MITLDNIMNNYLPLGYQYFKVCGRKIPTQRKLN